MRLSSFLLCNCSLVKTFLPVAITFNLNFYYTAETISKPDKVNPAFAFTQGGMNAPSCPLGMSCVGPAGKSYLFGSLYWPRSFVGYLLTKSSPKNGHLGLVPDVFQLFSFTVFKANISLITDMKSWSLRFFSHFL